MIGASGAIAGILGAYLVFNPRGNVVVFVWILVFIRLVSLPAVLLLGLWFFLQLASALSVTASEPGVAFWARVGGFVAGIFLLLLLRRRGTRLLQPRRSRAFYTSRSPRCTPALRTAWRLGRAVGMIAPARLADAEKAIARLRQIDPALQHSQSL
jgi:hypothetical protein